MKNEGHITNELWGVVFRKYCGENNRVEKGMLLIRHTAILW